MKGKNDHLPQAAFGTKDVDLMLWQFAVGILQLASHDTVASWCNVVTPKMLAAMDALCEARYNHLTKSFGVKPSFKITFSFDNSYQLHKV